MTQQVVKQVDCRGQQCPAPIISTTRAAKALAPNGGVLRVLSDDAAFPSDIESWCRSTNAELVGVEKGEGHYAATLTIPASLAARGATAANELPSPVRPPARPVLGIVRNEPETLDCRGLVCPAPIVKVAKLVRTAAPAKLRILADDPAFRLDIATWCESSGYAIERVAMLGEGTCEAIIERLASAPAPAPAPAASAPQPPALPAAPTAPFDVRGLGGQARIQAVAQRASQLRVSGGELEVLAGDVGFVQEVLAWCGFSGHTLTRMEMRPDGVLVVLAAGEASAASANAQRVEAPPAPAPVPVPALADAAAAVPATSTSQAPVAVPQANACALLILHNDLECLLAAMLVANGALAQGMDVSVFFSFWGLNLLRGDKPRLDVPVQKVSWMQRMMKWMMPKGPRRQKLGQMNFGGAGKAMLGHIMKTNNIMDLPALMDSARENGARFIACTMSMSVMGITPRDLMPLPNLELGGVATFVGDASRARMTMTF
ncbi:MAG: sulfurtransferase TusA family protein [Myxococcota bacterium]